MSLPNSRILIHQPSAGFEGQATDIEIHAAEILKTRKRIDEIYAKHTGQPEEQVRHDMERDRFFKADQAAEYGLIDRVISRALSGGGSAADAHRLAIVCSIAPSPRPRSARRRPRRRNCGGSIACPTPSGVPVRMRSPGSSVIVSAMKSTSACGPKIRSAVRRVLAHLAVDL